MKKILIIQSRTKGEVIALERSEYLRALDGSAEASFVSSLDATRPWEHPEKILEGFNGVIIGGSGEFYLDGGKKEDDTARATALSIRERLSPLLKYCVAHDIPTLGICFGHQLIGDVHEGAVCHDARQSKVGTHDVVVNSEGKNDPLLSDMPERFSSQYGHKDSVTKVPRTSTILSTGPQCLFSGLRYGNKVYTFQFHPELSADDVRVRLSHSPEYVPSGVSVDSIVRESPEASTLIPKFVEMIA